MPGAEPHVRFTARRLLLSPTAWCFRGGVWQTQSASLRAEEAIENALDAVQVVLFDIPANLQAVAEHRLASTGHHPELPAQIREVLHLWGLPGLLRPTAGAGGATAKYVAQDLAKDVAAWCWRTRLSTRRGCLDGSPLPARHGNLDRSASDDHRFDAPVANALLQLQQNLAENVPAWNRLRPGVGGNRRRFTARCGSLPRIRRFARRLGHCASKNLAQDIPKIAARS